MCEKLQRRVAQPVVFMKSSLGPKIFWGTPILRGKMIFVENNAWAKPFSFFSFPMRWADLRKSQLMGFQHRWPNRYFSQGSEDRPSLSSCEPTVFIQTLLTCSCLAPMQKFRAVFYCISFSNHKRLCKLGTFFQLNIFHLDCGLFIHSCLATLARKIKSNENKQAKQCSVQIKAFVSVAKH